MDCPACSQPNAEGSKFCASCGALLASAAEPGGALVGRTIGGRYLIRRVVGEGGMGVVYEAEQRMGDGSRAVAIKTLHPELTGDRLLKERFLRECSTVSQLEHPNTIRFYDFGEMADGTLYVAMEFVRGPSLTATIDEGPMPVGRVLHILQQIAGALDEAHEKGIIHRDLKPDNIILTYRGEVADVVKLLDFGIATRERGRLGAPGTKLTEQGIVLGTPPYMSPEQLTGEPLDRRSDVYSLGVIVYEMLEGRLPFQADSPWEWANAHVKLAPSTMQQTPRELQACVLRALAKRRDDRPASAGAFFKEFAAVANSLRTLDDQAAYPMSVVKVRETPPMGVPAVGPEVRFGEPRTDVAALPLTPPGGAWQPPAYAAAYTPQHPPQPLPAALAAPRYLPPAQKARSPWPWVLVSVLGLVTVGTAAVAYFGDGWGRSGHADPDPSGALGSSDRAMVPTTIAPVGAELEPPGASAPLPAGTTPATVVTTKPTATTRPTTTTKPTTTAPPATTTPPPTGPQGDAACSVAGAQAGSGNIEGAVASYRQCQSTGGSAGALATAKSRIAIAATAAVRARGFNGDCNAAKSAASSANSIGAGAGAMATLKTVCPG